jgi:hypothetical protein
LKLNFWLVRSVKPHINKTRTKFWNEIFGDWLDRSDKSKPFCQKCFKNRHYAGCPVINSTDFEQKFAWSPVLFEFRPLWDQTNSFAFS